MSQPQTDHNVLAKLRYFLGSRYFFYAILLLCATQAIWYAISFWPGQFDEGQHFNLVELFSYRLNPYIVLQRPEWDSLGAVTSNSSFTFYYILSWPLKITRFFTDSYFLQVLILRLIMTASYLTGLIWLRKTFQKLNIKDHLINCILLLLVVIPGLVALPGAINYDNVIFMLTSIFLFQVVSFLQEPSLDLKKIYTLLIIALFGTLVKTSFVIIAGLVAVYLLYFALRKWRISGLWKKLRRAHQDLPAKSKLFLAGGVAILLGLYLLRPALNYIEYRKISPSCVSILGEERCIKNYTAARNIKFEKSRPPNLSLLNPIEYFRKHWLPGMINTESRILPFTKSSPTIRITLLVSALAGVVAVMINLRSLLANRAYRLFLITIAVYIALLLRTNYLGYLRLGQPVSINGRYLLPILPLFICLSVISLIKISGKKSGIAVLTALVIAIILLTQRGFGLATSNPEVKNYKWESEPIFNSPNRINQ